jgi:hypothetical protein
MTLGIAHVEGNLAILDLLRERRPPFSPEEVVAEFGADLRRYRVSVVTGDKYGAEWVREAFTKKNMAYRHADLSKSDIYNELIPLINSGGSQLLDNDKLIVQLANLERKTIRGGKTSIDHPRGLHDDLANSAAGALVYAASAGFSASEFAWVSVEHNPDSWLGRRAAERRAIAEGGDYNGLSVDNPSGMLGADYFETVKTR